MKAFTVMFNFISKIIIGEIFRFNVFPHSSSTDHESQVAPANRDNESHHSRENSNIYNQPHKWWYSIVPIYITAIGICLQAIENTKKVPQLHDNFQFHLFLLFLLISLLYLTVSVYVRLYYSTKNFLALIVEQAAVFFAFMAFLLLVTIFNFPTQVLKFASAIFILSLFVIFLAAYLWRPVGA